MKPGRREPSPREPAARRGLQLMAALRFREPPMPRPRIVRPEPDLHERDYAAWLARQAAHLRAGRLDALDAANLAEELDTMGRSERRALESHVKNVLLHMLKWEHQPRRRSTSWELSIDNGRDGIADVLRDSPSLRPQIAEIVAEQYPRAQHDAAKQMKRDPDKLPADCPYSWAEISGKSP